MNLFKYLNKFGQLVNTFKLSSLIKYLTLRLVNYKGLASLKIKGNRKVYLRFGTTDIDVFDQIFTQGEFSKLKLDNTKIIFDAGSNIGLSTVYFSHLFPSARIFSIEPEKGNLDIMKLNLEKLNNVTVVDKALWFQNDILSINDRGTGNWGFNVTKNDEISNSNLTDAVSINELMREFEIQKIDIVKLDIEGAEKEVFENNYDHWIKNTRLILVEVHDYINPKASQAIFTTIINYDFHFEIMGEYLVFRNNDLK